MADQILFNERRNGISIWYIKGQSSKPTIVMAKGLQDIPSGEFKWMFLLNCLGFNVVCASYRGTGDSDGEFIPNATGELSVIEDISNLINFSSEKFHAEEVYIAAASFGVAPALVASVKYRRIKVSKIVAYAGAIFTDKGGLAEYEKEKASNLGEKLLKGDGEFFRGYNGFNLNVWHEIVSGMTELNPYREEYFPEIAKKHIFGIHQKNDEEVPYKRTESFFKAIREYCERIGTEPQAKFKLLDDKKGHTDGFGEKEAIESASFLTGRSSLSLKTSLIKGLLAIRKYTKRIKRQDGNGCIGVPFYDAASRQIEMARERGRLCGPLNEILNKAYSPKSRYL